MFRKQDPHFAVNENLSVNNQLKDGEKMTSGGRNFVLQSQNRNKHVDVSKTVIIDRKND